jgi:hypothetical protein
MKKTLKFILGGLGALIIIFVCAFFFYVSDYYKADTAVKTAFDSAVEDESITVENDMIIFHAGNDDGSAMIFYPGGKVESIAYYPLLKKLSDQGITCVLMKMPFHLAFFSSNAADKVYDKLPGIKNFYIGGHSLGGAMASSYMAKHQDKLSGLILLGAYIYGDIDPSKVLTMYGSNDRVLNRSKITYEENVQVIAGGNHAYFGNYGEQKGDGTATITQDDQQNIAANAVVEFIRNLNSSATK